jgi:serine/threonine protein kinase
VQFLEYVPGGSIASLLKKFGAFSETVTKKYTYQILRGLEYLHGHQIMHRDIKGANILADDLGACKLADFGASVLIENLSNNEDHKSLAGTPFWMAPEVIKQTGHGRQADIWSVGCTVLEMLTGEVPWSHCRSAMAAMFKIANSEEMPPMPPALSAEGKDFLYKCLQRYVSCALCVSFSISISLFSWFPLHFL